MINWLFPLDELTGLVMYPNKFIESTKRLSLNADKILAFSIYLYQHRMKLKIPRNYILTISAQYKNVDRINRLFEELRKLQIELEERKTIKGIISAT